MRIESWVGVVAVCTDRCLALRTSAPHRSNAGAQRFLRTSSSTRRSLPGSSTHLRSLGDVSSQCERIAGAQNLRVRVPSIRRFPAAAARSRSCGDRGSRFAPMCTFRPAATIRAACPRIRALARADRGTEPAPPGRVRGSGVRDIEPASVRDRSRANRGRVVTTEVRQVPRAVNRLEKARYELVVRRLSSERQICLFVHLPNPIPFRIFQVR